MITSADTIRSAWLLSSSRRSKNSGMVIESPVCSVWTRRRGATIR
jgi:hypothetical protein